MRPPVDWLCGAGGHGSLTVDLSVQPFGVVDGIVADGGLALLVRGPRCVQNMQENVRVPQVIEELVTQPRTLQQRGDAMLGDVMYSADRAVA
jgi:hypothetical protein